MNKRIAVPVVAALLTAGLALFAQQETPVAPPPKVKSQAEGQALQALFQSPDADSRIKAADEFLVKFPDSNFKGLVNMLLSESYRQKNDYEKTIVYGERTLEADPKNYMAMIMLAQTIAQRTREFDLDREEKLGKVDKYVKDALELIKTAPRPRADITEEQWTAAKKDFEAQCHEALAMAGMARNKMDVAIQEFRTALSVAANPDPASRVRLAVALNKTGKYDEAIAETQKVIDAPDAHPTVKQYAQAERARALQAKNKGAAPAPGAAAAPGAAGGSGAPAPAPAPAPAAPPKQ